MRRGTILNLKRGHTALINSLKGANRKNQNRGRPPSGRHATLEGEYHHLKIKLNDPNQALAVQGSLGATRGGVEEILAMTTFRALCDP